MNRYGTLLVLVLGASFILTACGAAPATPSASPAPSATSEAQSTPTAATVSIVLNATLSDGGLDPTTFTAPVGAHVTFTVNNTRTDERDCIFRDKTTIKMFPGQAQWSLDQIAGGTTKSLEFVASSQPASFQLDCGLNGYSGQPRQPAANMVGTFDVK